MAEEIKCQNCGEIYQKGELHECKERQKLVEKAKRDIDSGHPDT